MISKATSRMAYFICAISSIVLFFAAACSKSGGNPDIVKAQSLAGNSPSEALAVLDSIDYQSLSVSDRHLYDLLSIKARDKAFIRHTSDSLILDVIDYFSSQDDKDPYAEAIYYGGRVYCDLGDYPTALKYFQKALDIIPDDPGHMQLRASVVSQYGGLLRDMRLYREAVPFIEKSLAFDRILKDTVNEVYDLLLLGDTYLQVENYSEATPLFHEALFTSRHLKDSFTAFSSMHLAELKYKTADYDSALYYIRDAPEKVKPVSRNSALTLAARIYLKKGLADSAFMYAKALIESPDVSNKQSGYHVILSPAVRKYLHPDSIDSYISQYRTLLETLYDDNENRLAINQQTAYNYSVHERERHKAEVSNMRLTIYLELLAIITLLLLALVILLRYRNFKNKVRLKTALQDIAALRHSLTAKDTSGENCAAETDGVPMSPHNLTPDEDSASHLKERLRLDLIELYQESDSNWEVPVDILRSEAYGKLQDYIAEHRVISDDDSLWEEIEEAVLACFPHLKENLTLLTSGNLKAADLRTALLIKCGVRPYDMGVLLGRTKGAISARRENLCVKLLGKQMGTKAFDSIIRRM